MKRLLQTFALALCLPFAAAAYAAPNTDATYTADALRAMDQEELNAIYLSHQAGAMPDGESHGTAVFFAGSILAEPITRLAALVWQGKVFETADGILLNKIFGFQAIKANVFYGSSLFDGNESIIIDYHDTSVLAQRIRDEIRLVAPNLYLGRAYWRGLLGDYMIVNFILDFNN